MTTVGTHETRRLSFSQLSIIRLINNKAVNYIEREEYRLAERELSRAFNLLCRATEELCSGLQSSGFSEATTDFGEEMIRPHCVNDCAAVHGLEVCMEYIEMIGPSPKPILLSVSSLTLELIQAVMLYNQWCILYRQDSHILSRAFFNQAYNATILCVADGHQLWSCDHFSLWLSTICASVRHLGRWPPHFFDIGLHKLVYDHCHRHFGEYSIQVALVLVVLAVANMSMSLHETAFSNLRQSLALFESSCRRNHIQVGYCYKTMGVILSKMKQYSEALEYFQMARNSLQQRQPNQVFVRLLIMIGDVHFHLESLDAALAACKEAKAIITRLPEVDHGSRVALKMTMGRIYQCKNDHVSAVKLFRQAVQVTRKSDEMLPTEEAALQMLIGTSLYSLKCYTCALQAFRNAVAIEENSVRPSEYVSMPKALYRMAWIYEEAGEYEESVKYITLSWEISVSCNCPMLEAADALYKIGSTCFFLQKFDCQVEALQACVRIRRSVLGNDHELVAEALALLRLPLKLMNHRSLCLDLSCEIYRIRLNSSKVKRTNDLITSLLDMAADMKHFGDNERSLFFYLHAEALAHGADNEKDDVGTILCQIYVSISKIFFNQGEFERSRFYLQKTLSLVRGRSVLDALPAGQENERLSDILMLMGSLEAALGNISGVMDCFIEVLHLWETLGERGNDLRCFANIFRLWRFEVGAPLSAAAA